MSATPEHSKMLGYLRRKWSHKSLNDNKNKSDLVDREEKENVDPDGPVSEVKRKRSFFSLRSARASDELLKPRMFKTISASMFEGINESEAIEEAVENVSEVVEDISEASSSFSDSQITTEEIVSWYIRNLDRSVTDCDLRKKFANYAGLLSVKVPRNHDTAETMGYGYVNYDTMKHAVAARDALNYTRFHGKELYIMPLLRDKEVRESTGTNVFISNLPFNYSTRELYVRFKEYGPIISCKFLVSRLQGFVAYEKQEDAFQMIKDSGRCQVAGRPIYASINIVKKDREALGMGSTEDVGMNSRPTIPNKAISPPKPEPVSTQFSIFIRNLPLNISDRTIRELVASYGEVQSVLSRQVYKHGGTWALVTLTDQKSVDLAIQNLNSVAVDGQRIFVTKAIPREEKDYARSDRTYPVYQYKILVSGLDVTLDKQEFATWCSSITAIKSVELYGMNDHDGDLFTGYGYIALLNDIETDRLMTELKAIGLSCYKVNIKVPNRDCDYPATHYQYLQNSKRSVEPVTIETINEMSSPVTISYLNPDSATRTATFSKTIEQAKKSEDLQIWCKLDSYIAWMASKIFKDMMLPSEVTRAKAHSLAEYMVKFFWNGELLELFNFLQSHQTDGSGKIRIPLNPLIRGQLMQSGKHLGLKRKKYRKRVW